MKTVIFDMYGVIIKDPEGGLMPFVNSVLPDLTFNDVYFPYWIEACIGGLSSLDFFKSLGFTGDLNKIEKEYLDTIEIDNSFYEVLPVINKYYRLALLSNDVSEWSNYLRDKFRINDFFDVIVISGDVGIKKPDVRIFNLILDELGQPASDCIFIDDRGKNLLSAQSLGMDTILFNRSDDHYDGTSVNDFYELTDVLMKTRK